MSSFGWTICLSSGTVALSLALFTSQEEGPELNSRVGRGLSVWRLYVLCISGSSHVKPSTTSADADWALWLENSLLQTLFIIRVKSLLNSCRFWFLTVVLVTLNIRCRSPDVSGSRRTWCLVTDWLHFTESHRTGTAKGQRDAVLPYFASRAV